MRRSSTTVSAGPATLRLRRYGAKPLQNSNDNTRPSAPATIRMTPTVLRLNPEVVTSTAKVKIAPTTNRKMLTPRLKAARLLQDASTVDRSPSLHAWLSSSLVDPVPSVAVTVLGAKDEPVPLEALQAASGPIGCNHLCYQSHPCCRQAVAVRCNP